MAFRFVFTGAPDQLTLVGWLADGMVCAALDAPAGIRAGTDEAGDEIAPALRPTATLSSGHYVRVDLARLDELMRMIGDLVIQRARLADALRRVEPHVPRRRVAAHPGERRRYRTAAARPA